MDTADDLADRIRASRVYAAMTHDDLADALGISKTTLRRIEAGTRPATASEIERIAAVTGVPDGWLVDGQRVKQDSSRQHVDANRLYAALAAISSQLDDLAARLDRIETRER